MQAAAYRSSGVLGLWVANTLYTRRPFGAMIDGNVRPTGVDYSSGRLDFLPVGRDLYLGNIPREDFGSLVLVRMI